MVLGEGQAVLYTNCKIVSMSRNDYENGFIMTENGMIKAVGPMEDLPGYDRGVNLRGMAVYPAFVDAHCHLGMWEDGMGFEGADGNEVTDPSTPEMRGIDAINPRDRCFEEAVRAGVLTVVTGPGSSNPIGGQLAAIKTYGGRIDEMILAEPVAMKMALGENPKQSYNEKGKSPTTRMATAAVIRGQLFRAARYMEAQQKADLAGGDAPAFDFKCEALLPVLRRELPVHFHAHRVDDIYTALRIAKEFNLDYTIIHGTEAHLIAEELYDERAKLVLGPVLTDRSKPELKNLSIEGAGVLKAAGVRFALCTDHPVIPIQYLPLEAALLVRGGLDRQTALKSITITAAQMVGIDGRVGSIDVGKDADFVVFDGDPLDVGTLPKMVIGAGEIIAPLSE